jgi:hypothetical protein
MAGEPKSVECGEGRCHDCGVRVQLRTSKGAVFYSCNGALDDAMCGATAKFSKRTSRKQLIAFEAQGRAAVRSKLKEPVVEKKDDAPKPAQPKRYVPGEPVAPSGDAGGSDSPGGRVAGAIRDYFKG